MDRLFAPCALLARVPATNHRQRAKASQARPAGGGGKGEMNAFAGWQNTLRNESTMILSRAWTTTATHPCRRRTASSRPRPAMPSSCTSRSMQNLHTPPATGPFPARRRFLSLHTARSGHISRFSACNGGGDGCVAVEIFDRKTLPEKPGATQGWRIVSASAVIFRRAFSAYCWSLYMQKMVAFLHIVLQNVCRS